MSKAAKAKRPAKKKAAAKSRPEWFEQLCDRLGFERSGWWEDKKNVPPELQRDPRQKIWEEAGLSESARPTEENKRRVYIAAEGEWPFPMTGPSRPDRPPRDLVYFDSIEELRADAVAAQADDMPYNPSERAYVWRRSMGNLFTRGVRSESPPGWPEWACGDERKLSAARVARWNDETHPLNPADGEFFGFAEAVVDWCDQVGGGASQDGRNGSSDIGEPSNVEIDVLEKLNDDSDRWFIVVDIVDIVGGGFRWGTTVVKEAIKRLIDRGLAKRKSKKSGAKITDAGKKWLLDRAPQVVPTKP